MLELPIVVLDPQGHPVEGARVTPWALRSSQGHGQWSKKGYGDSTPPTVETDHLGRVEVPYPRFAIEDERVVTLAVSLQIDHPSHAYKGDLHVDVALPSEAPYEVTLEPGEPVTVRPTLDGEPAPLEGLYAQWTGGRSWSKDAHVERVGGALVLPAQPLGPGTVRLVKTEGEVATHFSPVTEFRGEAGGPVEIDVELECAVTIRGRLDETVPRPVRNGRVNVWSLAAGGKSEREQHLRWTTWVATDPDGSFVVPGWPDDEVAQVIALCDGYCAASGKAPPEVENPRDPATDPFMRAQVFRPPFDSPVVIAMEPMVRVGLEVVDEGGEALAGVEIGSCPNVQWWNSGSQVYCSKMVRSERLMKVRDYVDAIDDDFGKPFEVTTGEDGRAELLLPVTRYAKSLYAHSDRYELPIVLGRREFEIELNAGETTEVRLRLQSKGAESLGDWDKLAGVVFGCSTREGRRICALPEVSKKMGEFRRRIREADDPRDPAILADAYAVVAEAFDRAGDPAEAAKWRDRAAEQAALASR